MYLSKARHIEILISEYFKSELQKVLGFTQKHLGSIARDPRMKDLLKNISKKDLIDFEYSTETKAHHGKINLKNIDFFA